MKTWRFDKNQRWLEIDDPLTWADSGAEFELFLKSHGYHRCVRFGDEFSEEIELYRNDKESWPLFFLSFCWGGCSCDGVYIYDFPSLLEFLKQYGSIVRINRPDDKELVGIVRHAFEAWHGHSSDEVCYHCDRREVEARRERVKNMRKAGT